MTKHVGPCNTAIARGFTKGQAVDIAEFMNDGWEKRGEYDSNTIRSIERELENKSRKLEEVNKLLMQIFEKAKPIVRDVLYTKIPVSKDENGMVRLPDNSNCLENLALVAAVKQFEMIVNRIPSVLEEKNE